MSALIAVGIIVGVVVVASVWLRRRFHGGGVSGNGGSRGRRGADKK